MFEDMIVAMTPVLIAVVPGVLRSVAGWAVKALEDKKITKFEWKKLCSTVIRTGLIGLSLFYGFGPIASSMGIEFNVFAAGFASLLADKFFEAIKSM